MGAPRRRFDPVGLGVAAVLVALVLAVVKPWDAGSGPGSVVPSAAPPSLAAVSPAPSIEPAVATPAPAGQLTWSDVRSALSRQTTWGIRAIVLRAGVPGPQGAPYDEWWVPVDGVNSFVATLDERDGSIVALGVTFPPTETPLDVRIWREHTGGDLEWVDARPVDDIPARGASLYLRPSELGAASDAEPRAWEPGQYRVDVLVSGGIREMKVLIGDRVGRVPDLDPMLAAESPAAPFNAASLAGVPTGLFIQSDTGIVPLSSTSGAPLDGLGAWLDVDLSAGREGELSWVARTYQPTIAQVGVVLPAYSTVKAASVRRIAPFEDTDPTTRWTSIGSLSAISYVSFGPSTGLRWTPGVYAITVSWADADGPREATWHLELRPGPLAPPPVLLAATRTWVSFGGGNGVLLGVTEQPTASDPLGLRLVDIEPQTQPGYPGMSGADLIGCGPSRVLGRPEVIGIVGPPSQALAPVATRILYPFSDQGPLDVLTASGSVPGLTLVAPLVTAEFGGPASYGLRAGTGRDAPGYTICIGFPGG